jgi:hypothetical protein
MALRGVHFDDLQKRDNYAGGKAQHTCDPSPCCNQGTVAQRRYIFLSFAICNTINTYQF